MLVIIGYINIDNRAELLLFKWESWDLIEYLVHSLPIKRETPANDAQMDGRYFPSF